jgi:hypothetical protein
VLALVETVSSGSVASSTNSLGSDPSLEGVGPDAGAALDGLLEGSRLPLKSRMRSSTPVEVELVERTHGLA